MEKDYAKFEKDYAKFETRLLGDLDRLYKYFMVSLFCISVVHIYKMTSYITNDYSQYIDYITNGSPLYILIYQW